MGNAVFSLRFDDASAADYAYIYPLLVARNMVAGFAVPLNYLSDPTRSTVAQYLIIQTAGNEIMCHGATHNTEPQNWESFVCESRLAADTMRTLGLNTWSWVQPGNWTGTVYNLDGVGHFGQEPDLLLRAYFAAYEAYAQPFDVGGNRYNLPRTSKFGVQTMPSTGGEHETLATLEAYIDTLLSDGTGGSINFHASAIGTALHLSAADFEAFLDYVAAKVALGTLTVLTPTQQLFATPV